MKHFLFAAISLSPPSVEKPAAWVDDEMISLRIRATLVSDAEINSTDVELQVADGVVTLLGTVGTEEMRRDVEKIAREIPNVKEVHNELRVDALGN